MDAERRGRDMETKVVIRKFLDAEPDGARYVSSYISDWGEDMGPGLDGSFTLHDGRNTATIYLPASTDEEYDDSLNVIGELEAALNTMAREMRMAYMDAQIRKANEESNAASEKGEQTPQEDREV